MAAAPQTIPAFLFASVANRGDEPALGFIRGGELHWRTWQQVADEAEKLAADICASGITPGDRVAQVSENRYEWIITDLALHLAEAVHVPIHVTLSGQQIAEQIVDSGARLVFVSNQELLARFANQLSVELNFIIHEAGSAPPGLSRRDTAGINPASRAERTNCDELATILYTSGTTGRPRGVMLSQQNLASNAAAVAEAHGGGADQTRLCILPLSHIYARTCDLYTWVYRGSRLVLAERRETLMRDFQLAKPTAISAVPYIYQRIAERVQAAPSAKEVSALRAVLGGKMERPCCGGAPLAPHVEAWYEECGLTVLPGYGLTETSPVVATSTTASSRRGSVGRSLKNVEVRIADDGEILVRAPSVMLGYWNDEAATHETIRDGWLQTGDLGEIDADGFLYIRGRKKELIVLSTGKNVFPTRVESLLTASPLIEQAAVFGDGCASLVALIVPAAGGSTDGEEPAQGHPATNEEFEAEIRRCLECAAHEEQVYQFAILGRPFSIDRGELTAKLSLCRKVIARNFAEQLVTMGASSRNHSKESLTGFKG